MCGRYSFAPTPKQKSELTRDREAPVSWKIRYNIAPTQSAYVITNILPNTIQELQWGLVPSWSKDGVNSGKLINARAETIFEKPSFRSVIRNRRCLVPADSFYEWRKDPDGKKLPFRIFRKDGELLYLAGIWDSWGKGASGKTTFSIITTDANSEMASLHNRMPLILRSEEARNTWLSETTTEEQISELLEPLADGQLHMYRVSEKVNGTSYDAPDLQEEVRDTLRLF